jgi:hypothetical protein
MLRLCRAQAEIKQFIHAQQQQRLYDVSTYDVSNVVSTYDVLSLLQVHVHAVTQQLYTGAGFSEAYFSLKEGGYQFWKL